MAASAPGPLPRQYSATYVSVCLAINVALSISIILLNKAVYTHVHFPNMTLTCVHFVFTTVGMVVCRVLGLFTFKVLPLRQMVPVSLTFCGFVVLTNLSLQSNTVGTYQIIKSMTTPVIIFIQSVFYARLFSLPVKLTLVRRWHGQGAVGVVGDDALSPRVQTPGYIPKKPGGFFWVHPPKKTHPKKPILLL